MMATTARPGLHILVGAGSFADAASALRIVEHLPAAYCASLGGVFVDDPDTIETCQLPDRRVVTPSGLTVRAPDPAKIRTILQAEARAFQQSLDRTWGLHAGPTPFTRRQGELVSTSLRAAESWDVLVIGSRPLHPVRGQIILLRGTGPLHDQVAVASRGLSQKLSAPCVSFEVGPETENEDRATTSNARHFDTVDQALRALSRTNALAVLVDLRDGLFQTQADLAQILEAARSPLIVFGASRHNARLEHSTQIPAAAEKRPMSKP